jgi:hypothetical protein
MLASIQTGNQEKPGRKYGQESQVLASKADRSQPHSENLGNGKNELSRRTWEIKNIQEHRGPNWFYIVMRQMVQVILNSGAEENIGYSSPKTKLEPTNKNIKITSLYLTELASHVPQTL